MNNVKQTKLNLHEIFFFCQFNVCLENEKKKVYCQKTKSDDKM